MSERVCWLLIGDGRDEYHDRSLMFLQEMVPPPAAVVRIDDRDHKLGFAGAIAEGWRQVLDTGCEYVFHAELDFTYQQPVPVDAMVDVLDVRPYLVQMSLMRQPVNASEKKAGGIVQQNPNAFAEFTCGKHSWMEQRVYFTTNPCVYRASLCRRGWPQVENSEGVFTHQLLKDPIVRFGIWGRKFAPPMVHHIGDVRSGTGY